MQEEAGSTTSFGTESAFVAAGLPQLVEIVILCPRGSLTKEG